ncbi:MAG: hypothetical protein CMJ58_14855 [Planctomycetaceae bacterium]|nr:hypothetical protein [Planctomycetaceae bacterium]
MIGSRLLSTATLLAVAATAPNFARCDSFGAGVDAFSIDFVTVGSPGNAPDLTGFPSAVGAVDHQYRIGVYEVSEQMIDAANALGGLGISHDGRGPDKPATSVSWLEAAKFANWLNTSTGNAPAYKFDGGGDLQFWAPGDAGYNSDNPLRNAESLYFLPTVDEWYKAAYYDPNAVAYWDYPSGSNTDPIPVTSGTDAGTAVFSQSEITGPAAIMQAGGLSPLGTMAQGGNVTEWQETPYGGFSDPIGARFGRGGNWDTTQTALASTDGATASPTVESRTLGFRVASRIPEPAAAAQCLLLVFSAAWYLATRRHASV